MPDPLRPHARLAPGVAAALAAAALFGAGTPLAKLLLGAVDPWLLAGLLYLGSGLGLSVWRWWRRALAVRLTSVDTLWFSLALLAGGVLGPVLLMWGLARLPASGVSLLLNAEGVFTALLAWCVFRENADRRIVLGMAAIVAGCVVLAWPASVDSVALLPTLAVLGACFAWAVDNNLTRKVSLTDATWIAAVKGLVAGAVNLSLAFVAGAAWPAPATVGLALFTGFLAYGVSLVLFVVGLRHLGTARTAAYFALGPFVGALLAVGLGEPVTFALVAAGALMAVGLGLHLSEDHVHEHAHEALEHDHAHVHDAHHQHAHDTAVPAGTAHSHRHRHAAQVHSHAHFPDMHHPHSH